MIGSTWFDHAVDKAIRGELLGLLAADEAAVTSFLADAENHRGRYTDAVHHDEQLPWPYSLLQWSGTDAPSSVRQVVRTVAANTARLRQIVRAHGWPGRTLVGEDGADAAWLLLQHACSEVPTIGTVESLAFVRDCLPLLRDAVDGGEAHPRHFAAVTEAPG